MQRLNKMGISPTVLRPWGGEEGGDYSLWAEYASIVGNLIEKFNLQVIEDQYLPSQGFRVIKDKIKDWPGGKRGPHLHYGGVVYAVNPEQWKVFTDAVIKECRARLDQAQEVPLPLDIVAEIGGMTAGLPL
jgi:hypothetical protein